MAASLFDFLNVIKTNALRLYFFSKNFFYKDVYVACLQLDRLF